MATCLIGGPALAQGRPQAASPVRIQALAQQARQTVAAAQRAGVESSQVQSIAQDIRTHLRTAAQNRAEVATAVREARQAGADAADLRQVIASHREEIAAVRQAIHSAQDDIRALRDAIRTAREAGDN